MPSVMLVEDHEVMGRMMARVLQQWGELDIWAILLTAEDALARLAAPAANGRRPDLALVDVSLPGMSGIELVAELGRLYPEVPCLMLSAHRSAGYVRQAMENGARGYVAKSNVTVLIDAVQQVLAGEIYLSEDVRDAWPD